jgi:hypothetical protein
MGAIGSGTHCCPMHLISSHRLSCHPTCSRTRSLPVHVDCPSHFARSPTRPQACRRPSTPTADALHLRVTSALLGSAPLHPFHPHSRPVTNRLHSGAASPCHSQLCCFASANILLCQDPPHGLLPRFSASSHGLPLYMHAQGRQPRPW